VRQPNVASDDRYLQPALLERTLERHEVLDLWRVVDVDPGKQLDRLLVFEAFDYRLLKITGYSSGTLLRRTGDADAARSRVDRVCAPQGVETCPQAINRR
jgi:hypothetical protein